MFALKRTTGRVSLSTLNVWMFGSRTTVKKVRNSLTWFSHGSGAALAPEPFVKIYKSRCVRILEFLTQNHERQNTTDTHKTNPQATH